MDRITEVWKRYERGKAYNNSLSPDHYTLVETNREFFAGNQWLNMPDSEAMSKLPKPVFNIIKRVASLFVASLTSSPCVISFEALRGDDPDSRDAAEFASAEVSNLLEKFKMDYQLRRALFDGAVSGDYCAHFWWDPEAEPYGGLMGGGRGEIRMELVDGENVIFGDPENPETESQPYILIVGRDTVENLTREAEYYGESDAAGGEIRPDNRFETGISRPRPGHANDGTDKCTCIYMYSKKRVLTSVYVDGVPVLKEQETVHVTKATRERVIFSDIDTGLVRYPVAWGCWERRKGCYHGRALVTDVIPNQIFINTMFAMVMRHLQMSGFPKTLYNAAMISRWSNEVGQAIAVKNLSPGQSLGAAAVNLSPADMSNQIISAIDKAMAYTKDCLGATDAQLGNVRPDNTSAIMVLQSAAQVPLENIRAGLYEWLEDIGAILLDMMGNYYGRRPMLRQRELIKPKMTPTGEPELDADTGLMKTETERRKIVQWYDFSEFRKLWLACRVDVGAGTYYSEVAMVQTLDNLRRDGVLDLIQYLERLPDRLVPRRAELIEQLKRGEKLE